MRRYRESMSRSAARGKFHGSDNSFARTFAVPAGSTARGTWLHASPFTASFRVPSPPHTIASCRDCATAWRASSVASPGPVVICNSVSIPALRKMRRASSRRLHLAAASRLGIDDQDCIPDFRSHSVRSILMPDQFFDPIVQQHPVSGPEYKLYTKRRFLIITPRRMVKSTPTASQIEKLREELRRHEYLYYVKDEPEISDVRFDRMMEELQAPGGGTSRTDHAGFTYAARRRRAAQGLRNAAALPGDDESRQHLFDGGSRRVRSPGA